MCLHFDSRGILSPKIKFEIQKAGEFASSAASGRLKALCSFTLLGWLKAHPLRSLESSRETQNCRDLFRSVKARFVRQKLFSLARHSNLQSQAISRQVGSRISFAGQILSSSNRHGGWGSFLMQNQLCFFSTTARKTRISFYFLKGRASLLNQDLACLSLTFSNWLSWPHVAIKFEQSFAFSCRGKTEGLRQNGFPFAPAQRSVRGSGNVSCPCFPSKGNISLGFEYTTENEIRVSGLEAFAPKSRHENWLGDLNLLP